MEEHCVDCGHGAHYHRYKGFDGLCGYGGCDCKQMVYPKHEAAPRPSPQVAPGLRDFDQWLLALRTDYLDAVRTVEGETVLYILDEYDKRAQIAAAQGGQVVDREKLVARLEEMRRFHADEADKDEKSGDIPMSFNEHGRARQCEILLQEIRHGDFNSAVSSTLGGTERVQKAWAAFFACPHPRDNDDSVTEWDRCYIALKHSIEALGTPQGSDSQRNDIRWVAFAPNKAGQYHVQYPDGTVKIHRFIKISDGMRYDSDDAMTFHYLDELIDQGCLFSVEPAHPVSAGEAEERGENE